VSDDLGTAQPTATAAAAGPASTETIDSVRVMTIQAQLPAPVVFGQWVMTQREFALVTVRSSSGALGYAYTLTRDGAVAEQIRRMIAASYVGSSVADRERTFTAAWRRSLASHAAGIGLRALSIVDLACWDLAAKLAGQSIAAFLGGRNLAMPATAIIGYPPGIMGPEETGAQTAELYAAGWRRFKAPIAATPERTAARLRAARAAAPDAWLGMDAAWVYNDVDTAADFVNSVKDVGLGWFEDVFPPGDARLVRQLRERTSTPIAMGDEQGGSYYPEALLAIGAVDVVRVDLTCMGGITRGRRVIDQALAAGAGFAPHMFPHVHSQVLAALGYTDVPIEWGIPYTGVHPMDDPLPQPTILPGGLMAPLPEEPGFGRIVDVDWIRSQPHDDPDGLLGDL
jgi:L-alanine-DL-glutamate epimerase-like enolase superfamily enzyme